MSRHPRSTPGPSNWFRQRSTAWRRGARRSSSRIGLSTIRAADKIVVMEAGRVVEEGTHEALMSLNGAYARLYRLQSSGDET
jgi:ABC-type transport system involved in Fe-S cluster assembly fused permease/ATPase subunit